MKICFPTVEDNDLNSKLSGHFGSAPFFLVVDTETNEVQPLSNTNQHHVHGQCNPVAAFAGADVDAAIVLGIGANALNRLEMYNIMVYQGKKPTIKENLELFKNNELKLLESSHACDSHHHDHDHDHSHQHRRGRGLGLGRFT
jgi:predicted Fe-Mo cluster-binding NifX family protein